MRTRRVLQVTPLSMSRKIESVKNKNCGILCRTPPPSKQQLVWCHGPCCSKKNHCMAMVLSQNMRRPSPVHLITTMWLCGILWHSLLWSGKELKDQCGHSPSNFARKWNLRCLCLWTRIHGHNPAQKVQTVDPPSKLHIRPLRGGNCKWRSYPWPKCTCLAYSRLFGGLNRLRNVTNCAGYFRGEYVSFILLKLHHVALWCTGPEDQNHSSPPSSWNSA